MTTPKRDIDWEAVEREYRAGQLSIREIARAHGVSDRMIRKKAAAEQWVRALADKVRQEVREKLARLDGDQGPHGGPQAQRAEDAETIDASSSRGVFVVTSHRRDIDQLHGLRRILATRLSDFLHGGSPDGPFIGEKETPGDLLEKLSRVTARLIPLERQAYNLDETIDTASRSTQAEMSVRDEIARRIARLAPGGGSGEDSGKSD